MAEYLNMPDEIIRRRVENAMQGVLRAQELQIEEASQRLVSAFRGASWDFYNLWEVQDDLGEYAARFAHAITQMERRVEWLAANPVEDMRARLEASAEAARVALEQQQRPEQRVYEDAPYEHVEADPIDDLVYEGPTLSQPWVEIDTSDPDMGAVWQETLAVLQERLEALGRLYPAHEQDQPREQGMGY